MLTNDYQRIAELPADSPLPAAIGSAMGAPMEWDGALRGVLTVGYLHSRTITQTDLALLETFAELAATACANASAHAGLAHVARTDGLTGCLNHAALHDGLAQGDRARAARRAPAAVADPHRPRRLQAGQRGPRAPGRRRGAAPRRARAAPRDAPLRPRRALRRRRVRARRRRRRRGDRHARWPRGRSSASATRSTSSARGRHPRDRGRRAVEPGRERDGARRPRRPRAAVRQAGGLPRRRALVRRACPEHFRPGRFAREDRGLPEPPPMPVPPPRDWPEARVDERLRKRTRQLALANELGARVVAMTRAGRDPRRRRRRAAPRLRLLARVDHRAARTTGTSRRSRCVPGHPGPWTQPATVGLVGRCLRTRRPVLANDVHAEPDYVPRSATARRALGADRPAVGRRRRCGASSTSRRASPTPSTRTTSRCSRRWPRRSAPRCAARSSTSSSSAPTWGPPRRSPPRSRPRTPYTADHAQSIVAQAEAVAPRARARRGRRCATCASPPSSTTSARSPSPRRSSTSPAR